MKSRITLLFLLTLWGFAQMNAQCPGCVIDIPASFPADTIYLEDIPPATQGEAYDEDISFRLPQTTDPIAVLDPSIPAGLSIDNIEIVGIGNIPPGLAWEANQTSFNVGAGETDGCIKICGTPLASGLYVLDIQVVATVFGIAQSASFPLDFIVNPAVSTNDGFAITPLVGCDDLTVSLTNNVPSGGNSGITYLWEFGDGTQSTDEDPMTHYYNAPGQYIIDYTATIDTIGYILSGAAITASDCEDVAVPPLISGNPDFYIKIFDPSGVEIFNSLPSITDTAPPVSFSLNILIGAGTYTIEVWDEDGGLLGGDDLCGTINFNQNSGGTITSGALTVDLNIVHPVTTVTSSDTINVFASPAAPMVTQVGTASCEGDMVTLTSSYSTNVQWFNDTLALPGETTPVLNVTETGDYYVIYTSADGCTSTSAVTALVFQPAPAVPSYSINFNYLLANNPGAFPSNYSLQWQLDGMDIPGATTQEYCVTTSGDYTLVITDEDTGCTNESTRTVPFIPSEACALSNADIQGLLGGIRLFPNPTTDHATLSFDLEDNQEVSYQILDVAGKVLTQENLGNTNSVNRTLDVNNFAAGMYFIHIQVSENRTVQKLLIR